MSRERVSYMNQVNVDVLVEDLDDHFNNGEHDQLSKSRLADESAQSDQDRDGSEIGQDQARFDRK